MIDVKVNLSVILPGSVMLSKEECLKTTQKEITKKTRAGKPYKKVIDVKVDDWDKMDRNTLRVSENGKNAEFITYYTRKCKPASQSLNISTDSYREMVDKANVPSWSTQYKWVNMNKKERLEAHLKKIVESLGGISYTYQVFED